MLSYKSCIQQAFSFFYVNNNHAFWSKIYFEGLSGYHGIQGILNPHPAESMGLALAILSAR